MRAAVDQRKHQRSQRRGREREPDDVDARRGFGT